MVNCYGQKGNENVDIVVIRENTRSQYAGREHEVVPGVIQTFQVTMTKFWSDRIAKYAFEFAQYNKRKKVTATTTREKDENFMKLADTFFWNLVKKLLSCIQASLTTKYLLITAVCDL